MEEDDSSQIQRWVRVLGGEEEQDAQSLPLLFLRQLIQKENLYMFFALG